jgi:hypothetical protein
MVNDNIHQNTTHQPKSNNAPKYPPMLPNSETNNQYGITAKAYLTYEQAYPEDEYPVNHNQFNVKRIIIW